MLQGSCTGLLHPMFTGSYTTAKQVWLKWRPCRSWQSIKDARFQKVKSSIPTALDHNLHFRWDVLQSLPCRQPIMVDFGPECCKRRNLLSIVADVVTAGAWSSVLPRCRQLWGQGAASHAVAKRSDTGSQASELVSDRVYVRNELGWGCAVYAECSIF